MGLAGRKQKQRIPTDPRNLSWADDASRFGLSYLSKFGWDASQGLGASGEGMKTHIKVQHKLDMMGIGAQHQRDPNGIAWKQNKDFEALLKRLNEQKGETGTQDDAAEPEMGICGQMFVGAMEKKAEEKSRDDDCPSPTTAKKRKHRDDAHPDSEENTKKRRKKEKKDKHQKPDSDISSNPNLRLNLVPSTKSSTHPDSMPRPRPMAHRARIRAAKRIAGKSASAISEILGIAPSPSASTSTPTPDPTSPPSLTPDPESSPPSLDNLTTSVKTVADYFKEKLLARSITSSAPPSTPRVLSGCTTPGLGSTMRSSYQSKQDETQQKGIGCEVPTAAPFAQMPGPEPVSENSDGDTHIQDIAAGRMRQKAGKEKKKKKHQEQDQ